MKFKLGQTVATSGLLDHLKKNDLPNSDLSKLFALHASGYWGILSEEDKEANDEAVKNGERILSAYILAEEKIYIITEWDRSATTALLKSEY